MLLTLCSLLLTVTTEIIIVFWSFHLHLSSVMILAFTATFIFLIGLTATIYDALVINYEMLACFCFLVMF